MIRYFSSKLVSDQVEFDFLETVWKQMFLMELLLRSFLCYSGPANTHIPQDSALMLPPLRNLLCSALSVLYTSP